MNQLCPWQKKLITYLKIEMGKRVKLWQVSEMEEDVVYGISDWNIIKEQNIFDLQWN